MLLILNLFSPAYLSYITHHSIYSNGILSSSTTPQSASVACFAHPGTALITCIGTLFQMCHILFIKHWIVKFISAVLCVTLVSRASSAPEIIVPPSCVVSECGWWPLGQRLHPAWTGPGRYPAAPGPRGQQEFNWSQNCLDVSKARQDSSYTWICVYRDFFSNLNWRFQVWRWLWQTNCVKKCKWCMFILSIKG